MPNHKLFEIDSDIGPLTVQIITFPKYIWVVICESRQLQIDGSMQIGIVTPYSQNNKATVINIAKDEHQAEKQYEQLCRQISNELKCFVVLSVNTNEMMSIADLRKISQILKGIGQSMKTEQLEINQKNKQQSALKNHLKEQQQMKKQKSDD